MKRYGNVKGFVYRDSQPLPKDGRKLCKQCRKMKRLREFADGGEERATCKSCLAKNRIAREERRKEGR